MRKIPSVWMGTRVIHTSMKLGRRVEKFPSVDLSLKTLTTITTWDDGLIPIWRLTLVFGDTIIIVVSIHDSISKWIFLHFYKWLNLRSACNAPFKFSCMWGDYFWKTTENEKIIFHRQCLVDIFLIVPNVF